MVLCALFLAAMSQVSIEAGRVPVKQSAQGTRAYNAPGRRRQAAGQTADQPAQGGAYCSGGQCGMKNQQARNQNPQMQKQIDEEDEEVEDMDTDVDEEDEDVEDMDTDCDEEDEEVEVE